MGASQDLEAAGSRRMLVNAAFWCLGLEKQISATLNVDVVGEFRPRASASMRTRRACGRRSLRSSKQRLTEMTEVAVILVGHLGHLGRPSYQGLQ